MPRLLRSYDLLGGDRRLILYIAYSEDKLFKDVGSRKQLFIDDDVISFVRNLTRRKHTPKKHPANPLISRSEPWEVCPQFRTSNFNVVRDGVFKAWCTDYYGYFGTVKSTWGLDSLCSRQYYMQSEDGLNWVKPPLGKHFVDGHDTNTVMGHPPYELVICPSIILDDFETDEYRRYKMAYLFKPRDVEYPKRGGSRHHGAGLSLAFSPDGIDWTVHEENPVVPGWISDVCILTRDPIDAKYLLFGRAGGVAGSSSHPGFDRWFPRVYPSRPEGVWGTRRRVYRLESEDGYNWSEPQLIFDPGKGDNVDDHHYGFVSWRVDDMYLGILNVLHAVDNTLDMYMMHSRDGLEWSRFQDHSPLVSRGGVGSYDEFGAETPTQPLVVGDELWFYYGGMQVHHDWWIFGQNEGLDVPEAHDPALSGNGHHLCLATLRLDGYVSLDATLREGHVETKPVYSREPHLFINGRCGPDGYIRAEVLDRMDNVWEGFSRNDCDPFRGDNIHHRVTWGGRAAVDGIPDSVKLRFYLKDAELYGFQFADA